MLVFFQAFAVYVDFFSKLIFKQNFFKNIIRDSNGLDPDEDQRSVVLIWV